MLGRRGFVQMAGASLALMVAGQAFAGSDFEEFRQEVAELLRRRRTDLVLSLPADDPQRIDIGEMHFFLGNLQHHVEGMEQGEREDEILGFFDKAIAANNTDMNTIKTWEDAKERLRIQIVPIEYRGQAPDLVSRDLSSKVIIAYAVDAQSTYQLVMQNMVKDWGVDADTLHAAAIAGLEAISGVIEVGVKHPNQGRGTYASFVQKDGYDAARLLVPGFMQRLRAALGDSLIVGIPNRDFMVAWTPDFSAHARFAAQVLDDSNNQGHPLTDELFIANADGIRLATAQEMAAQRAE
jgi:Protein of unknown function (DUF1444)